MQSSDYEGWKVLCDELEAARADELTAVQAVHRSFQDGSGGPTHEQEEARRGATGRCAEVDRRMIAFLNERNLIQDRVSEG